jgi:hypothetical protein
MMNQLISLYILNHKSKKNKLFKNNKYSNLKKLVVIKTEIILRILNKLTSKIIIYPEKNKI